HLLAALLASLKPIQSRHPLTRGVTMAKLNTKPKPTIITEEGAPAKRIKPEQQLRRLVMSCMLWENEFYVDGQSISEQICDAVKQAGAQASAQIAMEARSSMNLRH